MEYLAIFILTSRRFVLKFVCFNKVNTVFKQNNTTVIYPFTGDVKVQIAAVSEFYDTIASRNVTFIDLNKCNCIAQYTYKYNSFCNKNLFQHNKKMYNLKLLQINEFARENQIQVRYFETKYIT